MTDRRDPPPLPPDMAALLASERARPPADDAHVARLLERFEAVRAVREVAPEPVSPWRARWRRDLVVLATGLSLGAAGHALVARRAAPSVVTRTVYVPQIVEREVPVSAPSEAPLPAPAPTDPPAAPAAPRRRAPTTARDDADGSLAEERAAVEIARTALARGRPQAALDALTTYERSHRGGSLAEERASLQVIALAHAGRTAEARARAASFRRRWPESYLLPAVEAALSSP